MTGLPVKRLINVTVNLGPKAAQARNFDSLVVIGSTDVINTYERVRSYNGIEGVGVDFGTTDPEYEAAALFFGQTPQPEQLYIARWAETATSGELVGGFLTSDQQALSNWDIISDGAFTVSVDSVVVNASGLDFTGTTNLNGVAEVITRALEENAVSAAVSNPGGSVGTTHSYAPGEVITLAGGETDDPAALTVATTQVVAANVAVGGSGGTNGTQTVTGTTGTGTKFQASVTIAAGAITAVLSILVPGNYTVNPSALALEPVTGAGLTGAKLLVKMGVLTATVSHAGEYLMVPANPVAQASSTGNGTQATFTMTWDATVAAVCTWDGKQFIIESASTGPSSVISYLTSPGSGTDISSMMAMRNGQTAYPPVNGIVAESPLACVTILDGMTTYEYGMMFASVDVTNDQAVAVAGFIEAASNPHIYGITSTEAAALDPQATTDVGYRMKQLAYNRTISQYSESPYAIASAFGRAFTVDFNENNSTITLAYKTEPGVVPELLTTTQADSLEAKNYMYYATFDNDTSIIVNNVMASGIFFDDQQNADWFADRLQTDAYNALYTNPTKIKQTDPGVHQIVTVLNKSCNAALNNGILGEGNWLYDGFGNLNTGDYLPSGYYVYGNPIASQSLADRQARKSPPIQIAAIFAGAIQSVNITVNVQR